MTGVADFSGYATRNDVRCSDGRTILAGAFAHQDGETVPLVWQHGHDEPTNVLGHAVLENVGDGVKCYAYFNKTERAQHLKEAVRNGDIRFLSIFANQLRESAKQVAHGMIREVSLVIGGANPGATIENVAIVHSDGDVDLYDEGTITTGIEVEVLSHADTSSDDAGDDDEGTLDYDKVMASFSHDQMKLMNYLLSQALMGDENLQHGDDDDDAVTGADGDDEGDESGESTDADAEDGTDGDSDADDADESTNEADDADAEEGSEGDESDETDGTTDGDSENSDESDDSGDSGSDTTNEAGDDAVQHDNITQEDNSMTHNLFDSNDDGIATGPRERKYLAHSDVQAIAKKVVNNNTTLSAVLDEYALEHGIENIDYLFPDPKLLTAEPSWIARRVEWVDKVLNSVRKTPYARIKSVHADITGDEARARGYIKGNMKVEEFFELVKRETTPQTIYKKQKLDRDDVIDITELDVIAYVKAEMKLMLDEEIAGAILIGDGRSSGDDDKIKSDKIRSIVGDSELYTLTYNVNLDDASSSVDELIDRIIEARADYKGTGTPTFYTSPQIAAKFRTVKDGFDHRLYKNLAEVAEVLEVAAVVPVEIFSRVPNLVGVVVNLTDYAIGTDRGGQATMFDDFDLDFNKLRYLLETRLCGALTVPHSAQVFMKVAGSDVLLPDPQAPTFVANVVTVPTVSGVTYKNNDTNATLTNGSPVTLSAGQKLNVKAFAASGKYFADSTKDEWTYKYQA